ncbi:MAG TPA: hypothetical protein VKB51_14920 [bacterium]|nr:hypothetical protein [bacterium]
MTNRMPSHSAIPTRRPRRPSRALAIARAVLPALVLAVALSACAGKQPAPPAEAPAAGQSAATGGAQSAAGTPAAAPVVNPGLPVVDESFSIVLDENLYQLDEAMSLIARSLQKVADRTPTLAINSFYFGKEVDPDFRRKAEVVILDKLFQYNPNVRLVQCQECQKLETKITHGVLKLRKGIPSQDARRALAEKLGVDGFIDIGMFRTDGQLTVYLKVVEAKSGAIILVDELAGRRAPRRRALTVSFGELNFPITISGTKVNHKALALGLQESVKLTGRFSFGVDLILYKDNNQNNPNTHITLNTGVVLVPTLGFDILQVPSSTSRLIGFVGIGKLISPQLDYANLARAGVEMVVGDQLSVMFAYNDFFQAAQVNSGTDTLQGAGYEIRFGYRF